MVHTRKAFFLSIIALPVCSALLLRLFFKLVFPTSIGWLGTQDFDLFIPFILAGLGLAELLYREQMPTLSFHKTPAFLSFVLFGFALAVSYFRPVTGGAAWQTTLLAILTLTIASTIFWFVRPHYFIRHPQRWLLLPTSLVALSVPLYNHFGETVWLALAPITSDSVCVVATRFAPSVNCVMHGNSFMEIGSKEFTVLIAQGCDGLAGLFLWAVAWVTAAALLPGALPTWGWAVLGGVGLINLWLINLLRIVVLFFLGAPLLAAFGSEAGRWIFEFLFHSQLGFVLYGAAILATIALALQIQAWAALRRQSEPL